MEKELCFLKEAYSFLNGKQLRKELKNKHLVQALCRVHDTEVKNDLPSFLRRWRLWHLFSTGVTTEYRLLHLEQWLQDYEKVSMRPFLWSATDCVVRVDGCTYKGKDYNLRYLHRIVMEFRV